MLLATQNFQQKRFLWPAQNPDFGGETSVLTETKQSPRALGKQPKRMDKIPNVKF